MITEYELCRVRRDVGSEQNLQLAMLSLVATSLLNQYGKQIGIDTTPLVNTLDSLVADRISHQDLANTMGAVRKAAETVDYLNRL